MSCIYLQNSSNLTYEKQEHIFPAGLGGTRKLPKGVVSDQANELFSPMEKLLMESSLISMMRMHYGPGKRGSFSKNRVSQSQVTITRGSNGLMELTYTALSKPYSISQFTKDNTHYHISLRMPKDNESMIMVFEDFCGLLSCFDDKFVHLQSKELLDNQMIIGVHNRKLYCATKKERPQVENIKKEIEFFLSSVSKVNKNEQFDLLKEKVTQFHRFEESSVIARMYGKIAINVLAHLKGEEFVKEKELDDFKRWILQGEGDLYYTTLPRGILNEKIVKVFPKRSHWCLFTQYEGFPFAIVCFYGNWQRSFKLTKEKKSWFPNPQGYICDWENKKEYKLNEYVNMNRISEIYKTNV